MKVWKWSWICAEDHRNLETLGTWNTYQGNPQSREEAVWEREGWTEIHRTAGLQLPKPFEAHSTPPCAPDAGPASTVYKVCPAGFQFYFTSIPPYTLILHFGIGSTSSVPLYTKYVSFLFLFCRGSQLSVCRGREKRNVENLREGDSQDGGRT